MYAPQSKRDSALQWCYGRMKKCIYGIINLNKKCYFYFMFNLFHFGVILK